MPDLLGTINPDATRRIILACSLLMVALFVLLAAFWYLRKWFSRDRGSSGGEFWTFEDLRQMRARGDLTEGEYQALRASLISSFGATGPRQLRTESGQSATPEPGGDFDLEKGPQG